MLRDLFAQGFQQASICLLNILGILAIARILTVFNQLPLVGAAELKHCLPRGRARPFLCLTFFLFFLSYSACMSIARQVQDERHGEELRRQRGWPDAPRPLPAGLSAGTTPSARICVRYSFYFENNYFAEL